MIKKLDDSSFEKDLEDCNSFNDSILEPNDNKKV